MKTTKIYFALGIALIISLVNGLYAGNPASKNTQVPSNPVIRYQVYVSLPSEKAPCNLYQVEILNGNGYQVAPAKILASGVSVYEFYERGPVKGVRIARLVLAPIGKDGDHHFICDQEYFTAPAALAGPFENGLTYKFELFPQTQSPKW
ncbi:MAG: hypothetical protein NT040_03475 [Bacteroidetes bacterium]|nr:hypothetical protein [Bacteroidota bacterium]